MKAKVAITNRDIDNDIVFLKDMSTHLGGMTITNDAEHVIDYCRSLYGNRVRVVYLDTDGEWWEIDWSIEHRGTFVRFKPWHGLVWDKLSRTEA
jgi:hypothetical protein